MQLFVRSPFESQTHVICVDEATSVSSLKLVLASKLHLATAENICFIHNGRGLCDHILLKDTTLENNATISTSVRVRGGGGDGGSTGAESRSCYLEMYLEKKSDKVNPAEELAAKWGRCHLSGEPLQPPCVIDELGSLFNKEAVLHTLLTKTGALPHISSLRHVVEVKLHTDTPHTNGKTDPARSLPGASTSNSDSPFSCPLTGLPFNGRYKFMVHRATGHVLSEKALKEVPTVVEETVGGKWEEKDFIQVNPVGEQLDAARARVLAKMVEQREKKEGKRSKAANGHSSAAAAAGSIAAIVGPDTNGVQAPNGHHSNPALVPGVKSNGGLVKRSQPAESPSGSIMDSTAISIAKKLKAGGEVTKVYSSLFHTSQQAASRPETYCCRSLSARGMNLT